MLGSALLRVILLPLLLDPSALIMPSLGAREARSPLLTLRRSLRLRNLSARKTSSPLALRTRSSGLRLRRSLLRDLCRRKPSAPLTRLTLRSCLLRVRLLNSPSHVHGEIASLRVVRIATELHS